MNRRQFLMGSAAALIAAPAAVSADQWFIGFDASVTDRSAAMVWRVHDEIIYVEDFSTDVLISDYRRRWRAKQAEIVEIWGSVGR